MKKIVFCWIMFLLTIVSAEAAKGPRKFYLTRGVFTGSQALTACASGYHMASLREIFDTSDFKYDTTLGITSDDSGSGAPDGLGWIRTGYVSTGQDQIPGQDNCFAWTSNSSSDYGSVVGLAPIWNLPVTNVVDPWFGAVSICSSQNRVWCVQD